MATIATNLSEFRVNTATNSNQTRSSVTVLGSGEVVIAYDLMADDGVYRDLFVRSFDSVSGNQLLAETKLNVRDQPTGSNADAYEPSAVALPGTKNVVVVYTSHDQDGSGEAIYGRILDRSGNTVGAEFQLNTTTSSNQLDPQVASLSGGGFVAVWVDESGTAPDPVPGSAVRARVYDANGTPLAADFVVNTTYTSIQYEPSVIGLANNSFMVAWTDGSAALGMAQDIRARVFNANGTSSAEIVVPGVLNSNQIELAITQLSDGRILVTYTDWYSTGGLQSPLRGRIYASDLSSFTDIVVNSHSSTNYD